jgi:flagellar basal body-associated protein FliL
MSVEEGENNKRNSNVLIVIVSFLLLASIGLSVVGLLNGRKDYVALNDEESPENQIQDQKEPEDSLTDMFEKEFIKELGSDGVSANDPFKEICTPASGDAPAVSSFTLCQP